MILRPSLHEGNIKPGLSNAYCGEFTTCGYDIEHVNGPVISNASVRVVIPTPPVQLGHQAPIIVNKQEPPLRYNQVQRYHGNTNSKHHPILIYRNMHLQVT